MLTVEKDETKKIFASITPDVVIYEGTGYLNEKWNANQSENLSLLSQILEECARLGLLPSAQAKQIIEAYLSIRNCYHKRSLQGRDRVVKHGELAYERALVQKCWQEIMHDDPK